MISGDVACCGVCWYVGDVSYAVCDVFVHGVVVRVSWWKVCICYSDVFSFVYFDQL